MGDLQQDAVTKSENPTVTQQGNGNRGVVPSQLKRLSFGQKPAPGISMALAANSGETNWPLVDRNVGVEKICDVLAGTIKATTAIVAGLSS